MPTTSWPASRSRGALVERVARMVLEPPPDHSVLRIVVDADDLVAGLQKLLHDVAGDEPRRAGDQDFHVGRLLGKEKEGRGALRPGGHEPGGHPGFGAPQAGPTPEANRPP